MKTAISIPDKLFHAAEQLAGQLGLSRSELYRRAVARYLAQHSQTVIRETLDELYGPDPGGSRLDPAVEYLQDSSLPESEW
jgi:hypothetical protein